MNNILTNQDFTNLTDFFDGFIHSVQDVEYYTGYSGDTAERILKTIEKLRNLKPSSSEFPSN